MRGSTDRQMTICTVVDPGELIPDQHPIRRVRPFVESALTRLEPTFEEMYAKVGRPSIPPEQLLKASVLMALYSIRSERQFCERLQYDLLFKWFLGLDIEDSAFDATSFSKNRERLMDNLVSKLFFQAVPEEARQRHLLSNQHFTVDGTLLESWASLKSLQRKPNLGGQHKPKRGRRGGSPKGPRGGNHNPEVNWRGEKRSNETHQSKTDPEARLARKGAVPAKLCYAGHVLMENRNGLVVDVELSEASGRAERETGLRMLHRLGRKKGRMTVGAARRVRQQRFRSGLPGAWRDPAHCSEHHTFPWGECHRRADGKACRLCPQPTHAQTNRGDLRLVEDGRWRTQTQIHRSAAKPALGGDDRRRLQPGPDVEP